MRLIDADALIKNLSYLYTKNHIPIDMRAKEILTTIMEQPTAYDVDKVAGELKKHKDTTDLTTVDEEMVVGFTIYQGAFNDAIDKAIEFKWAVQEFGDKAEQICAIVNSDPRVQNKAFEVLDVLEEELKRRSLL